MRAFLSQVTGDPRLTIVTGALVTRILFEGGRAVGVEYVAGRRDHPGAGAAEVLVAAGTYNTAKLLMLSGLGPADHLRQHGIAVVADLPGVGAEPAGPSRGAGDRRHQPGRCGYFGEDKGWRMIRNGLQYPAVRYRPGDHDRRRVAAASTIPTAATRPTIQLYCVPIVYLDRDVTDPKPTYGVTLHLVPAAAARRAARVKLRSADPGDQPLVDCEFLRPPGRSAPDDRRDALRPQAAGDRAARRP